MTCTLCCTLSNIICNPLHHVYSNSWVLDVPHCLVKHVGAGLRGGVGKKWYAAWAMTWSRHIVGILASQDSLQHIDVEKRALWALPSGKSCMYSPPSPPPKKEKKIIQNLLEEHFFAMGPCPFLVETTSFASLTTKPVGPC